MSTLQLAMFAILFSVLPLVWLALRDPKRLRSLRLPAAGSPRGVLTAVVLLPGILLMATGAWPAFLIWGGALSALGWLLVQILARQGQKVTSE